MGFEVLFDDVKKQVRTTIFYFVDRYPRDLVETEIDQVGVAPTGSAAIWRLPTSQG